MTPTRSVPISVEAINQFLRLCRRRHNRKNWLFAGSGRGGHTAAILFSLMATCKQSRVNPCQWLAYVLEVFPTTESADYSRLLPSHFTKRFPL
jgi:hypothetical protein